MQYYGNGPSTGLDQTALGKINTGFVPQDIHISPDDKVILRKLSEEVAQIAASDEMKEVCALWKSHNALQTARPLVFCDPENGWNEIITENQMECKGKLARRWEMDLRKEIFWAKEMGDDKPLEPFFEVSYTVAADDWGMETVFHKTDTQNGSQSWDAPVKDYERDLSKLQVPSVEIDWDTTNGCMSIAEDVFEGILDVRRKGTWWWSLGLTLPAVMLRGLTNLLMDFAAEPDNLKALLAFISDAHLQKLDYLEQEGLLNLNNDGTYVGSGGYGFCEELPQKDMKDKVRCCDMWGFAESQETVCVSPDMYAEFVFPYEKPILDRFGLNCYGCCEPLNPRWETVRQHKNLRRVSVSPWADVEKMAELLSNQYIFSYKPPPSDLASAVMNENRVRCLIRDVLEKTKGCRVELIMKDNHTLGNNPENAIRWCKIAKEEIERNL
jgi:hypothetical protein